MRMTVSQLRRIISEVRAPHYDEWMLDVWNVVKDGLDPSENALSFKRALPVIKLFTSMGADKFDLERAVWYYYENVDYEMEKRERLFLSAGALHPQLSIPLIVGRNGKRYVYEQFNVTVTDVKGTVGQTVGPNPSDVWEFDPKTLELLRIPTYEQCLYRRGRFARRSDIESGRI